VSLRTLETIDRRVKVYPEGLRIRIVWTDPYDGRRRQARRTGADAALEAIREIVRQLDAPVPTADNRQRTVDDLLDWYLDPRSRVKVWSLSYEQRQQSFVRTWLRPMLGHLRCADLTHHHMRAVIHAARDKGLVEESLQSIAATCSGVVKAGYDGSFLEPEQNPAANIYSRQTVSTVGQTYGYVDPETLPAHSKIAELADHMGGRWEPWLGLQVLMAAYTGLRYGELAALTGERVNLRSGGIDVVEAWDSKAGVLTPPKWRRQRTTVIPTFLQEPLAARLDQVDGGLLFPHVDSGVRGSSSFHATRFGPARATLDWPRRPDGRYRWTWHTLRHVFCTWALASRPEGLGLEVADVSYFAGHHSPSFTYERYVGRRDGALSRAALATADWTPEGGPA